MDSFRKNHYSGNSRCQREPDSNPTLDGPECVTGRFDATSLATHTSPKSVNYDICGPLGFMKATISGLRSLGVSDDRLHHEFFGPTSEAL